MSRRCERSAPVIEALERRELLTAVDTVAGLYAAINYGIANDTITIAAGTYNLTEPLKPKAGQKISGAGVGVTVLKNAASWVASTAALPDEGASVSAIDRTAYLFSFADNTYNVLIANMTLTGPQVHGAMFGNNCDGLEMRDLRVENFLWCGVRTFSMANGLIHDCTFVDAGGRWQNGAPGITGGITGGGIYVTWITDSEIWNNTFYRTLSGAERNFYGIKGRQGNYTRIHHNTINVNFSIEFPHENDKYVEIDHNYLAGTVSIPKYGGGTVPSGGYTFHIHHNYFRKSYSLEWARSGAEIDHNLFDFTTSDDGGNLITNFADSSTTPAQGPTLIHDNLIRNPGRGLYASNGHVFNNIQFYNNHVLGSTTVTPRTEGMFGLPTATDFSTIVIKDNIFEFIGRSRPLFRNSASYASVVENNTLINVSDQASYANPDTGAPRGPAELLLYRVGAYGEYTVDQWEVYRTTDIVAWWKLDDAAGASVADASGGGYTGAAYNGPAWTSGKAGGALYFDGSNDYVELPTGIVTSEVGAVAMWVNTTKNFTNMGHVFYASAVTGGDGGGTQNELHVNFTADERIQFFIEGGSADVSITSPLTYADGLWHLVVATWDITGNAILYVDGAAVASAVHNAANFVCSARTRLGRPDAASRYYTGLLDDVRLYDRVLQAAEVAALWTAAGGQQLSVQYPPRIAPAGEPSQPTPPPVMQPGRVLPPGLAKASLLTLLPAPAAEAIASRLRPLSPLSLLAQTPPRAAGQ